MATYLNNQMTLVSFLSEHNDIVSSGLRNRVEEEIGNDFFEKNRVFGEIKKIEKEKYFDNSFLIDIEICLENNNELYRFKHSRTLDFSPVETTENPSSFLDYLVTDIVSSIKNNNGVMKSGYESNLNFHINNPRGMLNNKLSEYIHRFKPEELKKLDNNLTLIFNSKKRSEAIELFERNNIDTSFLNFSNISKYEYISAIINCNLTVNFYLEGEIDVEYIFYKIINIPQDDLDYFELLTGI